MPPGQQVASLQSPPPKAFGLTILQTSYSTWANPMLCLLAAKAGSADCTGTSKRSARRSNKADLVRNGGPARITRKDSCSGAGSDRADA
jgi:hypothetical protein